MPHFCWLCWLIKFWTEPLKWKLPGWQARYDINNWPLEHLDLMTPATVACSSGPCSRFQTLCDKTIDHLWKKSICYHVSSHETLELFDYCILFAILYNYGQRNWNNTCAPPRCSNSLLPPLHVFFFLGFSRSAPRGIDEFPHRWKEVTMGSHHGTISDIQHITI